MNVSSLSNAVRRLTSNRERDRQNGWRGFQRLVQLWIMKWPFLQERNLLTQSKRRWLTRRVQPFIQGLLAWKGRDSTLQEVRDISMSLVSRKVIKEEQQIPFGLWRSSILRDKLGIRMSHFSSIWKMNQSVVSLEKSFGMFLLELSCLLKEFVALKITIKN